MTQLMKQTCEHCLHQLFLTKASPNSFAAGKMGDPSERQTSPILFLVCVFFSFAQASMDCAFVRGAISCVTRWICRLRWIGQPLLLSRLTSLLSVDTEGIGDSVFDVMASVMQESGLVRLAGVSVVFLALCWRGGPTRARPVDPKQSH